MRAQWRPQGFIRKRSRRPGIMTLKWLSMPSFKPSRAAMRSAA